MIHEGHEESRRAQLSGPSCTSWVNDVADARNPGTDAPISKPSIWKGLLVSGWATAVLATYIWHRPEAAAFGPRVLDHLANLLWLALFVLVLHACGRAVSRLFI